MSTLDGPDEANPKRQAVCELLEEREESALLMDGYEDAIIGLVENKGMHVVYSRTKMIECDVARGMSYEEAEEWISYNPERAIPYMRKEDEHGNTCEPYIMEDIDA